MDKKKRIYPAKLLLFGEHTVLKGSSSLAIPYNKYYMSWVNNQAEHPDWLLEYVSYLSENCTDFLDIDLLINYIRQYTIEANIPIGYGLGSSGALTAAIYDVCALQESDDLRSLQLLLGRMESFFHGQSSGFDPLVSYNAQPVQKTSGALKTLDMQDLSLRPNCYLLDSGKPRAGKGMIEKFIESWDSCERGMRQLSSENDNAVNHLRGIDSVEIAKVLKTISSLQLEYMNYMIIPQLQFLWQEGLSTDQFYIKVCGAGGGGYYLVFSNYELEKIGEYKLEKVILR